MALSIKAVLPVDTNASRQWLFIHNANRPSMICVYVCMCACVRQTVKACKYILSFATPHNMHILLLKLTRWLSGSALLSVSYCLCVRCGLKTQNRKKQMTIEWPNHIISRHKLSEMNSVKFMRFICFTHKCRIRGMTSHLKSDILW